MKKFFTISFFILTGFLVGTLRVQAASNIAPTSPEYWAWNDVMGWMDFCTPVTGACTLNVNVGDTSIQGYASSSIGFIAFNCDNTNPSGSDTCATSNYKILNNGTGKLSGWAWSDAIGWISFRCDEAGTDPNLVDCSSVDYGVNIPGEP